MNKVKKTIDHSSQIISQLNDNSSMSEDAPAEKESKCRIDQPKNTLATEMINSITMTKRATYIIEKRQEGGSDDMFKRKGGGAEAEGQEKNIPYPKQICFILGSNLLIDFAVFCVSTSFILYMNRHLGFTQNQTTVIQHAFGIFIPFFCILGAIISDGWLGRFKTIFYCSIVYVLCTLVITLTSIPPLHIPAREVTIIFIIIKGISGALMTPSLTPFGADQFTVPDQAKQLSFFFLIYYFFTNVSALAGIATAPYIREDVYCFDQQCYALIFGVGTITLLIGTVIFFLGRTYYKHILPASNTVIVVCKIIWIALRNKCKERKTNPRNNWIDYADNKFDQQQLNDVKVLMRILLLFTPIPFFWALYSQQHSRWVFQATRLNGDMGSWDIKPEHMQLINPILILIFIPLFKYTIYPGLALIGIKRPLQKFTLGGMIASLSFVLSAILSLKLESLEPMLPQPLSAQLRIFNGDPCAYTFTTNIPEKSSFVVKESGYFEWKEVPIKSGNLYVTFNADSKFENCEKISDIKLRMEENKAYSLFLSSKNKKKKYFWYEDRVKKPETVDTYVRTLANVEPGRKIKWIAKITKHTVTEPAYTHNLTDLDWGVYHLLIDDQEIAQPELSRGGIYTFIIYEYAPKKYRLNEIAVTEPNSLNILWQFPQIFIMAVAEILVSVTGMDFSYSQAPLTMKSVVFTFWILTGAFGNVIVVIVAESEFFKLRSSEFFLFAGMMVLDMIIFMVLAYYYKPNNPLENKISEPSKK